MAEEFRLTAHDHVQT